MILKLEDVLHRAIESIGPKMRAGAGVQQLCAYANAISNPANGAFQHVQNPKVSADLSNVHCSTLVGKSRISGDHEKAADARQLGDDVLNYSIGKIVLIGDFAHVLEGQHRDRRLVG